MPDQSENQTVQKRRVGRSPSYPFINVEKALERARALHEQEGDYPAPVTSATRAWEYSAKSSGARQTLATLKYYGLVEVSGDGDTRKVKVSDTARRILLDKREDETERKELIRKVALNPAAHKTIYDQYPSGLASDGSVMHFLMFEAGFNEDAAAELLSEFKETAAFAGLYQPDQNADKKAGQSDDDAEKQNVNVGDQIQWASQGVDQFPHGATVLGFSDDGKWIFTDQGASGVPLGEVRLIKAANVVTPPQMPPHLLGFATKKGKEEESEREKTGSRKAVFPVEDGDVTLIFPQNISAGGLEELGQYLAIFLKKEQKKRSVE